MADGRGRVGTKSKIVHPGGDGKGTSRYTDILVTVNTNRKPYSKLEEDFLYDELEKVINDDLMTEEGLKKALPMENPNKIEEVILSTWSIETGRKPRGSRVHAHFIMSIMHSTNFMLRIANTHMRDWFNGQFSWYNGSNSCNVQVKLLTTSKLKNYIAKTGKSPPGIIINDFV
jgi:hypothetical protein